MNAPNYPLIDGYDGDGIQDHAWVPVAHAAMPEAAVEWLQRMLPEEVEALDEDGRTLRATGDRSWLCIGPCPACEGSGADEYSYVGDVPVRPFPACESCGGDGEQHDEEFTRWESCKPDYEGAAEFWRIEVVDHAD